MSLEEFVQDVQRATFDWGRLAIASGGSLKPEKCFWYLIAFKFRNGVPDYKTIRDFPPDTVLRVPAPDGSEHPIQLLEVTEAKKTLGVLQCPAGLPDAHLQQMKKHGLDWADKAATQPLPRRLARMSHDLMLVPRMKYGIECLLASPDLLSAEMRKVMFRCLPHLGVNRNFKTEFCTLSRTYQGLELVDWPIEKLSADILVMLQHWDSPGVLGCCLREAYQLLQMETGLEGVIFSHKFAHYGVLATHSWMKILWEYLDFLDIDFMLSPTTNIPPVREGDSSIIQVLFSLGWRAGRLAAVNRVRKFHRVHCLSCITSCDGKTIRPSVLSRVPSQSNRAWSLESPSVTDFRLWRTAMQHLSSSTFRLQTPLGRFIGTPHIDSQWFTDADKHVLCREIEDGSFALYDLDLPARFTRSGLRYTFRHYTSVDPQLSHHATVIVKDRSSFFHLHSSAPRHSLSLTPVSFLAVLQSWENQSLWDNLRVDGDGSWLINAICAGSLEIVHDGSYMKKVSPRVCSMALIIRCTYTNQELTCTWAECSVSADNYRAELLGALCCSLLLKAASHTPSVCPQHPVLRHCDNMGVVKHGNRLYPRLKDGQSQSDIIRLMKDIDSHLPFPYRYVWVESHTDSKSHRKHVQTSIERCNTRADSMAKTALVSALSSREFISSLFPFESIRVFAGGKKLTSSLRPFITSHRSRKVARTVFGWQSQRGSKLVDEEDFDLIYWDVFSSLRKEFPSPFLDWLSKHVTGMCGVNRHLSKWKEGVKNVCPSCKRRNEDIYHLTTCLDHGRTEIFLQMVDELEEWLYDHHTPPLLIQCLTRYLRGRNTVQMTDLAPRGSPYHSMALLHDKLGWRCFLEGRISTVLVQTMHDYLSHSPSRMNAADWTKGLVSHLLRITHRQWTYRNSVVHFTIEGRPVDQHHQVIAEMKELMQVDPYTLLPQYRHLFLEEDFEALGAGSTTNRLYWIAAAKAAIAASALARRQRRRRRHDTQTLRASLSATDSPAATTPLLQPPPVPREPGFRYKKRRLK